MRDRMQFHQWKRREFITLLGGAAAAWPIAARAQKPKVPRIGYLGYSSPPLEHHLVEALQQGLRKIGYVDGQNVAIEYRSAEGKLERLPALATELVGLNVDIIVTLATPGALAAKQATNTIPIVVAAMADPARDGLVASLSRPGGNVTGATFLGPELIPKRLGLLKEVVPAASRVTVLWHPGVYSERTMGDMLNGAEAAARTLRVQLQLLGVREANEFDEAFSAMSRDRADALLVFPSPMLYLEYKRIVNLVTKVRLAAVYPWREAVDAGGLMSYGASIPDMMRHAAFIVGRIFAGAKPADLPIEQPTKFELIVNLKSANALGLEIPPTMLVRADEVIE
jgi:putative tryptophan/tyrosine transport system substrate-binding protein